MSDLVIQSSMLHTPLPVPRAPVRVRLATMEDIPFMDALQKQHSKQLGYFPTKQFEGYVETGGVLIAEGGGSGGGGTWAEPDSDLCPHPTSPAPTSPQGYVISRDRYLKRDELGVIYQMCVAPEVRRGLVAATLLKEVFERSAYGCRLYCCWCAQDLAANRFWEAMGFIPIAFRGGSAKKKRVHILWQKRIVEGDVETKYWYPAKTDGGAMGADRIVLPIPPGVHWSDPMPVIRVEAERMKDEGGRMKQIGERKRSCKSPKVGEVASPEVPTKAPVQFGPPGVMPPPPPPSPVAEKSVVAKPRARRKATPVDPKWIAMSRELRDRWFERMNDEPGFLEANGKYDVAKALPTVERPTIKALPMAA